jgi:curved DNA-binding protein CbpA
MVNYYDILKVSHEASHAEIKSAYRRLARQLHPDANNGSEETALKFAAIAEAYEVLGNSRERGKYDKRLAEITQSANGDGTVFGSNNRHAQRWRQMVYEKRYNDIIDKMIAEERREAMAFQKVVYPTVALLISSVLTTAFKPKIFAESSVIGKIIIVSLFAVGVIHLIGRIRDGFDRYTDFDDNIHDSILDDGERKEKPYSRLAAGTMLSAAVLLCLGIGLLIGWQWGFAQNLIPSAFAATLKPEFIFYPPIITFFVDMMHTVASQLERSPIDLDKRGFRY